MESKKIKLGQFFTKAHSWLKPQIKKFIEESKCSIAYDPFAGAGDLLKVSQNILGLKEIKGLDIDNSLQWEINDSLLNIPHIENAIIITNPPYIAKQSASRKKIDLAKYFKNSSYDDVYLIALDKMLKAQKNIVAIVPESFINSSYNEKNKIKSITILEDNPFEDTENPVCVVCFDGIVKKFEDIKVYKNDKFINNLQKILDVRISPLNCMKIKFNSLNGWLGLRAIDSTDDKTFINFDFKENFNYDWKNNIKITSRHFSLIDIDIPENKRQEFINECNEILHEIRKNSSDILLTPFKGNTKNGKRRRRLDFRLARAIMEKATRKICKEQYEQQTLFWI